MFSEYASRFLAQSQSRISFLQPDAANESSRNPLSRERGRNGGNSRFPTAGSYQRPSLGNPYRPTTGHFSQFPFASRTSAAPAPLFYSATDEFQEDDEETEREREAADFYALQRSRRHFGASRLEESSEADDDGPDSDADADTRGTDDRGFRRGRGIRSSWRGDRSKVKKKGASSDPLARHSEGSSDRSSKDKGRMVDVGLESMINESIEPLEHPSEDLAIEMPSDENPPPFQQFRKPPSVAASVYDRDPPFLPYHNDTEADLGRQPRSSDDDSVPPTISYPTDVPPKHDSFWASLFLICLTSLFATFFLVYLHTSAPSRKHPLGDTIYTVLHSSFHLLAVDTLVAVIVSLVWLSLLRSFVRPLVYLILIAAPVILTSFAIYPLVASYKGAYKGASLQDKAMRWFSLIPAVAAVLWTYSVYKARHSFHKAIGILEFACRILAANPALLALGFGTLAGVVLWTWIWMGMFTRVFLGGHLSPSRHLFIIDTGSWWLGVYFVLTYLWTLAVGRGIQRAATAATVSQWYFHRLAVPAPSSRQVVLAAFSHATTTLFGTICLSTFLALLVRLPLLVLPRRLVAFLGLFSYAVIPSSISALTSPLTLSYAAIHSQPLRPSATHLGAMPALAGSSPLITSLPSRHSTPSSPTSFLLPYRLAQLLLHATRLIMALALGFGGWISTARTLSIQSGVTGIKGSLYAYVVGLIAGAIGWGVLGAMEGVIGGVLDAALVCWASEGRGGGGGRGGSGGGGGGYCLEAEHLFGGGL